MGWIIATTARSGFKATPEADKPHIRPNSCVANLFKMLTYYRVCCAFSSVCALLLSLI